MYISRFKVENRIKNLQKILNYYKNILKYMKENKMKTVFSAQLPPSTYVFDKNNLYCSILFKKFKIFDPIAEQEEAEQEED